MKIKIDDKVYLQKYEIADMTHNPKYYPQCVLDEVFAHGDEVFVMNRALDAYHFANVFKNPESIKWLMEQDWIVDYDEFAKKPLQTIKDLAYGVYTEETKIVQDFNRKDIEYRDKHFDEVRDKTYKLGVKARSLGIMIYFLEGEVTFEFPEGYVN